MRAPHIVETTVELYLGDDPPDDWALIDNLDADEAREVAKKALDLARARGAALDRVNALRSNVIATQNASWSNQVYPLVAILNDAGYELDRDVSDEQKAEHLACYGGAGGMPGKPHRG